MQLKMHRGEAYEAFQGAFYVDLMRIRFWNPMCYALQIDPMGDEGISRGNSISEINWKNGFPTIWTHKRRMDILTPILY